MGNYRVAQRTGVWGWIGLDFNLCVALPWDHIVLISERWRYGVQSSAGVNPELIEQ